MHLLSLSDQDLLAVSSTSPDTEDSRFIDDARAQFRFILRHAGADGRQWAGSVFGGGEGKAGKPLVFRRRSRCGDGDAHEDAGDEKTTSDAS